MARSEDTIVALATPPGRGALALVRLSGPGTEQIVRAVFARWPDDRLPSRRAVHGAFLGVDGEPVDEGLLTLFRSPNSYTGEDVAEMTVHGSPPVIDELLRACIRGGARPAEPGEFTLRALRNGKLDLTQAEAVADLVAAATLEQARIAARQLGGEVRGVFEPLASAAVDLLADVEGGLEFEEDERELALSATAVADRCDGLAQRIDDVARASETARRVREGVRVVLRGPPNAGKSSLFNALLREDRVIVTDEPGTTRDLIEETTTIEGLPVVLIDGAGLGEPAGQAERLGIRRAIEAASRAHLVLEVYDLTSPHRPALANDEAILVVGTRGDLASEACPPTPGTIVVSATTGEGIAELEREIARRLRAPGAKPLESVALATERHRQAALRARQSLRDAAATIRATGAAELAALDLRTAVRELRAILGEVSPDEILGSIFARFCIGK